jgi:hypothetical protein
VSNGVVVVPSGFRVWICHVVERGDLALLQVNNRDQVNGGAYWSGE